MIAVPVLALASFVASASEPAGRLNILLFTADDLHDASVGAFGGRPADLTPHLDRFATQGMRFDRAHVPPRSSTTSRRTPIA